MGYDCGDLRDYKKLIGTTNDGLQALRLFDESDDDLELVIPVSAKNAIEVPEFLFMSDIKNVTESKSVAVCVMQPMNNREGRFLIVKNRP